MLEERQILRYARQILLKEVGGRGQERLLSRPVEVQGDSEALLVAVTYLAAGGTPLRLASPLRPAFLGAASLADFNPDAVAGPGAPFAELVAAPLRPSGARPCVLVGTAGLCSWPTGPTPAALDAALGQLADAPSPAPPVLLGSLAAVALQRLLLGLSRVPQTISWGDAGFFEAPVL